MFNCKIYLEIRGCAIGTAGTSSYASILMGRFEKKLIIYSFIKDKVELFLRYIDDISFIWKGAEKELKNFFNELNKSILPLNWIKNN